MVDIRRGIQTRLDKIEEQDHVICNFTLYVLLHHVSAPDILKDIKWSENLNEIFIRNYQDDPSLSWQYFGSSSGFMRQYPGVLLVSF